MLGLEKLAGHAGDELVAELGCCPLWVAHYTGSPSRLPLVPRPWKEWTIWQASGGREASPRDHGTLPGTSIDVDVDYTRLTVEELVRLGEAAAISRA